MPEELQKHKILKLEEMTNLLKFEVEGLRSDVDMIKDALSARFDRLDAAVQDMKIGQVKYQEQGVSLEKVVNEIKEELLETKHFRRKIVLAVLGGGISILALIVQAVFAQ